ncbi:hypothetical protein B0H11DRAFT_1944246 [Mycena galericulata]|nr:hypothetical protein B0H11DRAFT_1944246 [Mycena galericulata]
MEFDIGVKIGFSSRWIAQEVDRYGIPRKLNFGRLEYGLKVNVGLVSHSTRRKNTIPSNSALDIHQGVRLEETRREQEVTEVLRHECEGAEEREPGRLNNGAW